MNITEIKNSLSFLRMWLNEDRITDHRKMVTTEDLGYWLGLCSAEEVKESHKQHSDLMNKMKNIIL